VYCRLAPCGLGTAAAAYHDDDDDDGLVIISMIELTMVTKLAITAFDYQ